MLSLVTLEMLTEALCTTLGVIFTMDRDPVSSLMSLDSPTYLVQLWLTIFGISDVAGSGGTSKSGNAVGGNAS